MSNIMHKRLFAHDSPNLIIIAVRYGDLTALKLPDGGNPACYTL